MTLTQLKEIVDRAVEAEGSNAKTIDVLVARPELGGLYAVGAPLERASVVRCGGTAFVLTGQTPSQTPEGYTGGFR